MMSDLWLGVAVLLACLFIILICTSMNDYVKMTNIDNDGWDWQRMASITVGIIGLFLLVCIFSINEKGNTQILLFIGLMVCSASIMSICITDNVYPKNTDQGVIFEHLVLCQKREISIREMEEELALEEKSLETKK